VNLNNKEIDARGLACPHPVIETKKVLQELEKGIVVTIVDNAAARDNVKRLAETSGCAVSIDVQGDDYYLTISKA